MICYQDTRLYDNNEKLSELSFVDLIGGLLEKANYERITEADLNRAMKESSLFKIRLHVDFEIDDALKKLVTLGIVQEIEGVLTAVPIKEGIKKLDQRWDNYFTPSNAN